jgi:endonuclease III
VAVKRRKPDPIKPWARRLRASRPGLVEFVLEGVQSLYGVPRWERALDPTSELVLTILSQNSADLNAEKAFDALRRAYPGPRATSAPAARAAPADAVDGTIGAPDSAGAVGAGSVVDATGAKGAGSAADSLGSATDAMGAGSAVDSPGTAVTSRPGWGGGGWLRLAPPDWLAVEMAPVDELAAVIRPGGLANQKAPRIQASLARLRESRADHSLEFLGQMDPLAARDWLTGIDGIGVKTASVVLMMSFGMPLMPVDRHVDRVSKRIGLIPQRVSPEEAHDRYLALLQPEQCYPLHVGLITHGRRMCHARLPDCDRCPLAPRCRYVNRRAP